MTAQIGNQYRCCGNDYTIVTRSDPMPFHPSEYGIVPEAACTACWSGFWCVYNITDDGIFLEDLFVNSRDDHYPAINGILPDQQEENNVFTYMGHHRYGGLNIKIPYTGKILVGSEFLHEYYIHAGYQKPWAYKKLVEIVFKDGKLVETNDQSRIAAKLRKKMRSDDNFMGKLFRRRFGFIDDCGLLDEDENIWWL